MAIGVLAIRRLIGTPIAVIAAITHSAGVVLGIGVAAPGHYGRCLAFAHTLELGRLLMVLSLYRFLIITEIENALKKF